MRDGVTSSQDIQSFLFDKDLIVTSQIRELSADNCVTRVLLMHVNL